MTRDREGREDSEDRETQSDTVNTMSAALTAAVVVLASLATCDTAASVAEVTAAASSSASLPCNMTSSAAGDSVRLVLWFRGDMMTPVYSLDSRGELLLCSLIELQTLHRFHNWFSQSLLRHCAKRALTHGK